MSKLTMTGFSDEQYQNAAPAPSTYEAMLNPESIARAAPIHYDGNGSAPQFDEIPSQALSFELVIDCTGIVDANRIDLKAELDGLAGVLYSYKSKKHRPNFVKIVWGTTLQFKGVLTSMDISYTFFKPDGTALRARVTLRFSSYVDAATRALLDNNQSPDVTHHVLVREGDSLPLIAHGIYGTPDYFLALARANQLNKFRRLDAGTTLLAPPLKLAGVPRA